MGTPSQTNQPFDGALSGDPGGSWCSTIVTIKIHDKKIFDLLNYAGGDGFRIGLAEPNQYSDWQIYESLTCA
ncbi:MAG TPA: hypothetical protein EYQ61_11460 [Dehalococcoidia bacterium]|nr:hypothetical protein [Dehalococcoidia bacterium]HIK89373.1 hypothetical protein [Dehalococcoidia bacterium]